MGLYSFFYILGCSPGLHQIVELSLLYLEWVIMQKYDKSTKILSESLSETDCEFREGQEVRLHSLQFVSEIVAYNWAAWIVFEHISQIPGA